MPPYGHASRQAVLLGGVYFPKCKRRAKDLHSKASRATMKFSKLGGSPTSTTNGHVFNVSLNAQGLSDASQLSALSYVGEVFLSELHSRSVEHLTCLLDYTVGVSGKRLLW